MDGWGIGIVVIVVIVDIIVFVVVVVFDVLFLIQFFLRNIDVTNICLKSGSLVGEASDFS